MHLKLGWDHLRQHISELVWIFENLILLTWLLITLINHNGNDYRLLRLWHRLVLLLLLLINELNSLPRHFLCIIRCFLFQYLNILLKCLIIISWSSHFKLLFLLCNFIENAFYFINYHVFANLFNLLLL